MLDFIWWVKFFIGFAVSSVATFLITAVCEIINQERREYRAKVEELINHQQKFKTLGNREGYLLPYDLPEIPEKKVDFRV